MESGQPATPDRMIQEFSRAPHSLDQQLTLVPTGALLIVTYTGQLPGTKPGHPPRKMFRVQWRRPTKTVRHALLGPFSLNAAVSRRRHEKDHAMSV